MHSIPHESRKMSVCQFSTENLANQIIIIKVQYKLTILGFACVFFVFMLACVVSFVALISKLQIHFASSLIRVFKFISGKFVFFCN